MTLEGWPDMARTVMVKYPYAWIVFISFIIMSSYIFLNLVIGIIVTAMQDITLKKNSDTAREAEELAAVRAQLAELSKKIDQMRGEGHSPERET